MHQIPDNPVSTWEEYFEVTLQKPLHPLFSILEPYLPPTGRAFDLGCGVGHAVVWLANRGWTVDAIDGHPEALRVLASRLSPDEKDRVHMQSSRIEDAELTEMAYDLGIAAYSLFFAESREAFGTLWSRIRTAIKPGGLFVGEFLGVRDDWAGQFISHTDAQVQSLLEEWEVVHLEEAEQDGHTSMGTEKHWHVFHVIARRV